jgi:long-chain acyl-CoA synthetase
VETVWRLDADGLDELGRAGERVAADEVARRRGAATSGTLATIVYTSGTTGRPKGCMISHGNLTEAVRAIIAVPGVREQVLTGDASSLFFLPLSHVLARAVMLCLVHAGKRSGFLPDPDQLPGALVTFRPTILLTVPRVLEKVAAAARQQAGAEGHQRLFAAAEATAVAWSRSGRRTGPWLRLRHALFGRSWHPVRRALRLRRNSTPDLSVPPCTLRSWPSTLRLARSCGHFGNGRGGRASDRRNPRMAAGFSGD